MSLGWPESLCFSSSQVRQGLLVLGPHFVWQGVDEDPIIMTAPHDYIILFNLSSNPI